MKNQDLNTRRSLATPRGVGVMCDFYAVRAENATLWDADGKEYIDFAGGIAVLLPPDLNLLRLQQRLAGCELQLPDSAPIAVTLVVCSQLVRKQANGMEQQRVGLRFEDLPRGADAAIQRYIFRVDRERKARKNGGA